MNQKISILRNENEFLPRKKLFPKKTARRGRFSPSGRALKLFGALPDFAFYFYFPSKITKGNLSKNLDHG